MTPWSKLPYAGAVPPERYAIWYAALIYCIARAKCVSLLGRRNPRVVKRRTSYGRPLCAKSADVNFALVDGVF